MTNRSMVCKKGSLFQLQNEKNYVVEYIVITSIVVVLLISSSIRFATSIVELLPISHSLNNTLKILL